jgi:predicted RND superfamily exporter protein
MKTMVTVIALLFATSLLFGASTFAAQKEKGKQPESTQSQMTQQRGAEKKETGKADVKEELANPQDLGPVKVSAVEGKSVKNQKGESLGTISDVFIGSNGTVVFAILSHGGFLGIGDRLIPISWDMIKYAPEQDVLVLAVDKKELEKAPSFETKSWPDLGEPGWKSKLDNFYKKLKAGTVPERQK